ncbi:MAG: hypothetical protein HQM15_08935, partial [Deltaproteobacteria bacterium]|nr:hypothetical protein [Deltaproteobacteria bacterium]
TAPRHTRLGCLRKDGGLYYSPPRKSRGRLSGEAKQDYKDLQRLWNQPKEEISKGTEKLGNAVQHEWNEFTKPFESSNPNVRAKAWGKTSFDVGSIFVGAGEMKGVVAVEKETSLLSKAAGLEEAGLNILAQTEKKIIPEAAELMAQGANGFEKETLLSKINSENAPVALYKKLPAGFSSQNELKEFANIFKEGLAQSADPDALGILRGSAVTGIKHDSGLPFDVGKKSDFDLAVVSPKLVKRVEEMGMPLRGGGTRSGPLGIIKPKDRTILKQLQLLESAEQLKILSNRKISIMFYETETQLSQRGKYIKF